MIRNGIDVSKHQGNINWKAVKESGVEFAILRAGYGRELSQKDEKFEQNYAGCKQNGIPCGVYWYSYALSAEEARKEATVCLEVIKGKTFEYPIYFDIEEGRQFTLGATACTAIAKAFLETVEKAGYWVGVYSSKAHLLTFLSFDLRERYAVWVAHYGVDKTNYPDQYGIWQKSSSGRIAGIQGNVDLNECYIDYPALIKSKGLNGFKATETAPEKEPEKKPEPTCIKYSVKKGDTLWDIAKKYLGDGSRYPEIKKASGITSDTIYPNQKLKVPVK